MKINSYFLCFESLRKQYYIYLHVVSNAHSHVINMDVIQIGIS